MADPGYPIGGAPTHLGGANLLWVHFLAKMYVKMKEIGSVGGGMRWRRPSPGSANVNRSINLAEQDNTFHIDTKLRSKSIQMCAHFHEKQNFMMYFL